VFVVGSCGLSREAASRHRDRSRRSLLFWSRSVVALASVKRRQAKLYLIVRSPAVVDGGRGIGWLRKMRRRSITELERHDQPQAQLAYRANPANPMKPTRAGSKVPSAAGTFLKQLGLALCARRTRETGSFRADTASHWRFCRRRLVGDGWVVLSQRRILSPRAREMPPRLPVLRDSQRTNMAFR
jgi:hypothetical protein